MGNQAVNDARPEQYATVIRELIRHEDDVTNHRIMWLLIVQGLLANAFAVLQQSSQASIGIATAGILVSLSAFVMLYKSYQARGYLHFLGDEAKNGRLQEKHLPLDGWPPARVKHWRIQTWMCPWLQRAGDVLEPYLFLPAVVIAGWWAPVLRQSTRLSGSTCAAVGICLSPVILSALCVVWVWSERANEEECPRELDRSSDGPTPREAGEHAPRSAA